MDRLLKTLYLSQEGKIRLEWTVKKGVGLALEDFSRSAVALFVIGKDDRIAVPCNIGDAVGVILAEIGEGLDEGIYSLELIWAKNGDIHQSRCLQRSRVDNVFCITRNESEAETSQGSPLLRVTSVAHTYGYDGLSAYEAAVLRGYEGSEEDFYRYSDVRVELESLQDQIDNLVVDGAKTELVVSPSVVLVGEESSITLTATSDVSASSITIKRGSSVIATGTGNSLTGTTVTTPSGSGNTGFTASFVIAGLTKSVSKNVTAVYPVRYGAGSTYSAATQQASARMSPAGTYNVSVSAADEYVWFVVPSSMTINGATMSGFDFPLESPDNVTVDGVNYKAYRSSNTYGVGTLTIVIR